MLTKTKYEVKNKRKKNYFTKKCKIIILRLLNLKTYLCAAVQISLRCLFRGWTPLFLTIIECHLV